MRFELEFELNANVFSYSLALEYPPGFRELRVLEEKLLVNGDIVYLREIAQVRRTRQDR